VDESDKTMNAIEILKQRIGGELPGVSFQDDPPQRAGGSYWLNVQLGERAAVVEWRPNMGFGLSSLPSGGYGEGPDEVYEAVSAVADRLLLILRDGQMTEPPREALLRRLRETRRVSQEELATTLGVNQSAVSKMERRTDMNISSLRKLIEALGGELELLARFPEYTVKISQFERPEEDEAIR
jgi:DNA-binding XRE family transcriptional regulator